MFLIEEPEVDDVWISCSRRGIVHSEAKNSSRSDEYVDSILLLEHLPETAQKNASKNVTPEHRKNKLKGREK